jgi:CRP-like cAMP-binding protein
MTVRGLFMNATERREIAGGETLFAAGDAGGQMFGLISGQIELRRGDHVIATVAPGGTFGEMAIIDDAARTLDAVAIESSEVAVIDRRAMRTRPDRG